MSILLAGGAGYIGSHTAVELIGKGYDVIIADNLSNSYELVIDRIEEISGKRPKFYKVDTRESDFEIVFKENKIDLVVDFAAYKSVGDSVKNPVKYYDNNLFSLINTLKLMEKYSVKNIVFSSSATVYGLVDEDNLPVKEDYPRTSLNPYGSTKIMGEEILEDLYKADKSYSIAILRYFNPIGAHQSGLIGEESTGIPANIMPYSLAADARRPRAPPPWTLSGPAHPVQASKETPCPAHSKAAPGTTATDSSPPSAASPSSSVAAC